MLIREANYLCQRKKNKQILDYCTIIPFSSTGNLAAQTAAAQSDMSEDISNIAPAARRPGEARPTSPLHPFRNPRGPHRSMPAQHIESCSAISPGAILATNFPSLLSSSRSNRRPHGAPAAAPAATYAKRSCAGGSKAQARGAGVELLRNSRKFASLRRWHRRGEEGRDYRTEGAMRSWK
jgi:hypothetical protein